jgi:hypothetical protein
MSNIINILDSINSFTKLPNGWNFGEGVPASLIALRQSKNALVFAHNLGIKEFEVFPGIDGEIQICCYKEEASLEITFEVDGLTTVSFEEEDGRQFYKKGLSFDETIKILKDFAYNKCRLYGLSTLNCTTVKRKTVSQVWRLDPHLPTAAYPSSIKIVPLEEVGRSVSTLSDITPELQEPQSYFGKFLPTQSQHCPV